MTRTENNGRLAGIISLTVLMLIFSSLISVPFAHAEEEERGVLDDIFDPLPNQVVPKLQIDIPTVQLSEIQVKTDEQVKEGELRTVSVPWLAEYIGGIYKFGVGIAGALAAVMMMIGGFQYLTAGGDAARVSAAKKRISDALAGLLLSLGVYLILFTLNPDLVDLRSLEIQVIKRTEFSLPDTFAEDEEAGTSEARTDWATTTSSDFKKAIKFNSANIGKLEAAAALLVERTKDEDWGPATIKGSGGRMISVQARLFKERCIAGTYSGDGASRTYKAVPNAAPGAAGRTRCTIPVCNPFKKSEFIKDPDDAHKGKWLNEAATPFEQFCPHTSGWAVDISCSTSRSSIHGIHVPCHLILEQAMKESGFCRLSSEPWHFEQPILSKSACSVGWTIGTHKEKGTPHTYSGCDGWYDSYSTSKTFGNGSTSDSDRCAPE